MSLPVALVESQPRVLARVAGEAVSRFFEDEHRAHGVDLYLGSGVRELQGRDGRVAAVVLEDGRRLAAELVIAGIGLLPEVDPLLAAGADGGNGVRVDARCCTSLADVFAIGDCALHRNRYARGAEVRLESLQNANDQALVAAREILGDGRDYDALPWFWSNQYDVRLQTAGLSGGHDAAVLRGDPDRRGFSVIYLRQGRVIALDCINAAPDYAQGRSLVAAGAEVAPAALADPAIPLKQHLSAALPASVHED
ncbi:MAG: oxidoreductase C-terminal domain-containing protein [Pseudomonas sp.]